MCHHKYAYFFEEQYGQPDTVTVKMKTPYTPIKQKESAFTEVRTLDLTLTKRML